MWIKVCGIRDCATARQVADLNVDAVGLNFYPRSPRRVAIEDAIAISKLLPAGIARVGVFVNHPIPEVESIASQCQLDLVQLHGDEPPSYFIELHRRLPKVRFIRAWRMGKSGLGGLKSFVNECQSQNFPALAGCLVDAHVEGVFGGSGTTLPWGRLAREYRTDEWPPFILAGGLTPTNVAEAIAAALPWGVDVASGVESASGVKDFELMRQFVENARTD
jgi:phosphoribosylanthranilate isomerase